jgi:hypothetical protein
MTPAELLVRFETRRLTGRELLASVQAAMEQGDPQDLADLGAALAVMERGRGRQEHLLRLGAPGRCPGVDSIRAARGIGAASGRGKGRER